MSSAEQAILLVSGGLDSTVLAHVLVARGTRVTPLFIDYGQHSAQTELDTARSVLPASLAMTVQPIQVRGLWESSSSRLIHAPDLWRDRVAAEDLMLPNRNVVLLTLAAAFAAAKDVPTVIAAFINSNHAREVDATARFIAGITALVSDVWSVQLEMPFSAMSKAEVVHLGLKHGVPLWRTYSCQANPRVHCGACPNCRDRLEALASVSSAVAER